MQHFVESSALALDALGVGMPPGRRRGLAFTVVLHTLAAAEPDLGALARPFTWDSPSGRHPYTSAELSADYDDR